MKKQVEKIIIHNPEYETKSKKLNILRIQILPEYTKVDYGYLAVNHYIRGGWVQIYENSFIRDLKTKKCYSFIKAENIPIAPTKHFFTSNYDYLYYSLYFEPIPVDTEFIDIIESEEGGTYFNFYKVNIGDGMKDLIL